MIEKTIKYYDLRGNEVEDTFYFNLTKAEAMGLGFEDFEGMKFSEVLLSIQETEDPRMVLSVFKTVLRQAVGMKQETPRGEILVKPDWLKDWFIATDAYSELLEEMLTDPDYAVKFIGGILPKELQKEFNPTNLQDLSKEELLARFKELSEKKANE